MGGPSGCVLLGQQEVPHGGQVVPISVSPVHGVRCLPDVNGFFHSVPTDEGNATLPSSIWRISVLHIKQVCVILCPLYILFANEFISGDYKSCAYDEGNVITI